MGARSLHSRFAFAVAIAVAAGPARVGAAEPCEAPSVRDLGPLLAAVRQDRELAEAYADAAEACRTDGEACVVARARCVKVLEEVQRTQSTLDDGWWLRDLLVPYLGRVYPTSRAIAPPEAPPATSCTWESPALVAAATWRTQQAERRQALANEYPAYARWASEAHAACRAAAAERAAKAEQERAEAARAAAAAAAAKAAEEQQRVAAAQQRAEEAKAREAAQKAAEAKAAEEAAARTQAAEAERRALAAQEAEQRASREAAAAAQRKAEEEARRAVEAEARARAEQEATARAAEEQRLVQEREQRKAELRKQRETLLAEAEAAARAAREKAEALGILDEDERSVAALSVAVGGGYGGRRGPEGSTRGPLVGAAVVAHAGLWATAPAAGLASGFEVRAQVGFSQAPVLGTQSELSGNLSARYFVGRLGLGLGAELRNLSAVLGDVSSAFSAFGAGPALGFQFVDTPRRRVAVNAMWLPLGRSLALERAFGDVELSFGSFACHLVGGLSSDGASPARTGWFAMGLVGLRLGL